MNDVPFKEFDASRTNADHISNSVLETTKVKPKEYGGYAIAHIVRGSFRETHVELDGIIPISDKSLTKFVHDHMAPDATADPSHR